jgi:hypothetical protein
MAVPAEAEHLDVLAGARKRGLELEAVQVPLDREDQFLRRTERCVSGCRRRVVGLELVLVLSVDRAELGRGGRQHGADAQMLAGTEVRQVPSDPGVHRGPYVVLDGERRGR